MRTKVTDPVIPLLRTVPGLKAFDDRTLLKLVPLVEECHLEAGTVLTREGVPGRQAFLIVDGQGTVTLRGQVLAEVGPGHFVGEMALLDGGIRCATACADTPLRALVISTHTFPSFVTHPGVARSMAIDLARCLRRAEGAPRLEPQHH